MSRAGIRQAPSLTDIAVPRPSNEAGAFLKLKTAQGWIETVALSVGNTLFSPRTTSGSRRPRSVSPSAGPDFNSQLGHFGILREKSVDTRSMDNCRRQPDRSSGSRGKSCSSFWIETWSPSGFLAASPSICRQIWCCLMPAPKHPNTAL
jgi:hypothetical protein